MPDVDTMGGTEKGARSMKVEARWRRARVVVFVLAVLGVLGFRPASQHARAASLLMTFSDKDAKPAVTDERTTFDRDGDRIDARLYRPAGVTNPPGVVLVHGVNHFGIDDVRLERFARAVASAGVLVMTPAVSELSDYHVAPRSIDTVGAAVMDLQQRVGGPGAEVGLMGMSFGGGISLLAAADERFSHRVSFVVAVGAHDDLGRVSRFFVTDEITKPNGEQSKLEAHGYGMMILVYTHVEDFFPADDVAAAREALRLWIWEKRDDARKTAEALSPASKDKFERLVGDGAEVLRPEMLALIDRHGADMAAVSPHGRLGSIRANVYLLHGEGDTVIPASETAWLAEDVPPARLKSSLITPALEHVDLKNPSAADQWALVHFMGQVIAEADAQK
ncbi:MAG: alpha/beta hydrolase [Labilithrix sp.]|nr:alpha/beta hydrolase [Labilithrix sp.]MCW5811308.1 alpha/beta hydrolase [Labilithrix sp.]